MCIFSGRFYGPMNSYVLYRFCRFYGKSGLRIPVDTRSPIPVISVQSVGDLQYRWQS